MGYNYYPFLGRVLAIITLLIHLAITQPIDGPSPTRTEPGVDSLKSINNGNLIKGCSPLQKDNTESKIHYHPCVKDDNDQGNNLVPESIRRRRSTKSPSQQQPSAELQTIMSGNWHGMDPTSLFKLLNTLATSKETLPDDYYGYDEPDDQDPIDLVYSGRSKPLLLGTTTPRGQPGHGVSATLPLRGQPPLAEPISIMSSNMYHARSENYDESQPLQKNRVTRNKKLYSFPGKVIKRSSLSPWIYGFPSPSGWSGGKDLVQLPNGEIAFSPFGIRILRNHQPVPLSVDEQLTLVRRPIL